MTPPANPGIQSLNTWVKTGKWSSTPRDVQDVTIYVLHKTWMGWSKPFDYISLSQFEFGTVDAEGNKIDAGCRIKGRRHIQEALQAAIEMGFLIRDGKKWGISCAPGRAQKEQNTPFQGHPPMCPSKGTPSLSTRPKDPAVEPNLIENVRPSRGMPSEGAPQVGILSEYPGPADCADANPGPHEDEHKDERLAPHLDETKIIEEKPMDLIFGKLEKENTPPSPPSASPVIRHPAKTYNDAYELYFVLFQVHPGSLTKRTLTQLLAKHGQESLFSVMNEAGTTHSLSKLENPMTAIAELLGENVQRPGARSESRSPSSPQPPSERGSSAPLPSAVQPAAPAKSDSPTPTQLAEIKAICPPQHWAYFQLRNGGHPSYRFMKVWLRTRELPEEAYGKYMDLVLEAEDNIDMDKISVCDPPDSYVQIMEDCLAQVLARPDGRK